MPSLFLANFCLYLYRHVTARKIKSKLFLLFHHFKSLRDLSPPKKNAYITTMPPRLSRVSTPRATSSSAKSTKSASASSHQKSSRKRKARGLDALNIAEHTHADRVKVKQYRLGEVEGEEPRSKKRRLQNDDEDGDEADGVSGPQRLQRKTVEKGGYDRGDGIVEDSGSDSEGGRWRVGMGEEDENSDVDSEEAFGSGDEERFGGFSFKGSKDVRGKKSQALWRNLNKENGELDLIEDDGAQASEEDEESGFGDDGVDLATMLDDDGSEDEAVVEQPDAKQARKQDSVTIESAEDLENDKDDEEPSEYSDEDGDGKFEMSDDEESDADDPSRQAQLQDLVRSRAAPAKPDKSAMPQDRSAMLARALAALQGQANIDPSLSREAQRLSRSIQPSTKDSGKSTLVSAPLPKRQQDRIDRIAARQETNKTLDRWVDTVKHNRRAEHLTFPLPDPHAQEPQGLNQLVSTAAEKPRNELEQTIANLMKESGLGQSGGKASEKQLETFEQLQANKMPLEEVLARRAELRKQRELMFREEIKARRIKKIKSKAYRRVHRKDAQKQAQKEHDLLVAAGIEGSDDEREANDRRRAEERMGGRHRESRWAKSVKQTGRAAWDNDARDGVTEMARRGEELRRRQEGKREEVGGIESDVESTDDEEALDGDDDAERRLHRQLGRVDTQSGEDNTSRLGSLKFMQRADAAQQKRNDEDIQQIRKSIREDDSEANGDDQSLPETSLGRKVFGPTETKEQPKKAKIDRAEFEELDLSDSEAELAGLNEVENGEQDSPVAIADTSGNAVSSNGRGSQKLVKVGEVKTFKAQPSIVAHKAHEDTSKSEGPTKSASQPQPKAPRTSSWTTVSMSNSDSKQQAVDEDASAASDAEPNTDAIEPSNWDLVQSAFGNDDVEKAFEDQKASAASSEDEKFEDKTLPGWGSWAGSGISKKALKRAEQKKKGRFITKTAEGIKPADRKDAKIARVIISEKRQKKNAKYLASQLPHPFESRTQYERGLRQPVGPEWTTKQTFQDATKPRIMTKPGRAIMPMSAPML